MKAKEYWNPYVAGVILGLVLLAAYLVAGSTACAPVIKFQNAGIVCLEKNAAIDHWYVKWMLMPQIA